MILRGMLVNHLHEYPSLIAKVFSAVKSKDIFGNADTASQWQKK